MNFRALYFLLACLLALASSVSARSSTSPQIVVTPPVFRFGAEFSERAIFASLTMHLDGLHDRAGPHRRVLVRQNPWSKFDPDGLQSWGLTHPQGYWDANYRNMTSSPQYQEGFKQGMAQGAAVGLGVGAVVITGVYAGPAVAAYVMANPGTAYMAAEAASTAAEMATGYEGPSLPGPGDAVRAAVKVAKNADSIVTTAKDVAEEAKTVVYRELSQADRAALEAGEAITPKGTGGTILDHVRGKATGHISASETAEGTARFKSGSGLAEIDVAAAEAGGAKFIPHKQVIEGVGPRPKQVQKVQEAREVMFEGPIPREAVKVKEK